MILIIFIIVVLESILVSSTGILAGIAFLSVLLFGLLKKRDPKVLFKLSLAFITMAVIMYLTGFERYTDTVILKLSNWSFIFLILGLRHLI